MKLEDIRDICISATFITGIVFGWGGVVWLLGQNPKFWALGLKFAIIGGCLILCGFPIIGIFQIIERKRRRKYFTAK